MSETPDILKRIVSRKREELAARMAVRPLDRLAGCCADMPPTRGFEAALRRAAEAGQTAIIAEVKKGSPSKGVIRPDFEPVEIARTYEANGATCLSVLTEEHFFMGHLDYLGLIRESVNLPLLRKDFIFDPYQIHESRCAGADAILLIAAMLEPALLRDLHALASELQLDVLLEVHDEAELESALLTSCTLIGVNNRSLRSFVTDLGTTVRLAGMLPPDRLLVSESGINNHADIQRLTSAGAAVFLIGESLMAETDIGAKLRELLGEFPTS